jgi:hypothetical protein
MLKCNAEKCPNKVTRGFKHEMSANHSGSKGLKAKSGESYTLWCDEHEDDFQRNLDGFGEYLTEKELYILEKMS